jgi:hypothetical protein
MTYDITNEIIIDFRMTLTSLALFESDEVVTVSEVPDCCKGCDSKLQGLQHFTHVKSVARVATA